MYSTLHCLLMAHSLLILSVHALYCLIHVHRPCIVLFTTHTVFPQIVRALRIDRALE